MDKITIKDFFREYNRQHITYQRARFIHRVVNDKKLAALRKSPVQEAHTMLAKLYTLTNEAITHLDPASREIIASDCRDKKSAAEVAAKLGVKKTQYFCSRKKRARLAFAAALNDLLKENGIPLLIRP